ncbi:CheR family methyltransferase [Caballeronia sp. LZ001]|uniref:CheR family methyltransferase n=3 Tax=Caballeronia TaxID=1827195 RepID=UPI00285DBAD7|nr:CheR family methyltransferase [Caballeronia sp. LZ001]MDR5798501.1 CheR family methyltransferase [Caballeronia sp. LZ001]
MEQDQQNAGDGRAGSLPLLPDASARPLVVGIGGSAGGLQATMALLETLGAEAPLAIVVVLHLSPDHESSAAEILQRVTPLTVSQVRVRTRLEAGHVYVIAPATKLITDDGHVQPGEASRNRPSSVIDLFFRTLGEVHEERAIGIVLSGTGQDGSLGLASIKERGGLTIAQEPDDAEYGEMPQAAINTGAIDLVLSAEEIGRRLVDLARAPRSRSSDSDAALATDAGAEAEVDDDTSDEKALYDILAALRNRNKHDFRHYKRATVQRRIERRMRVNRLTSIAEYRDFVRRNPGELSPLLADLLISVTSFFRDQSSFSALQNDLIPNLMNSVPAGEEARIWVPACASGEESYSVAILIQEYADRMPQPPRVQIVATDINEAALEVARAGIYPANISADVTESRLLAYFEKEEDLRYRVHPSVRQMIVFAQHNVLSDPPFSRLDLVCCRNLLIYLDRTAQAVVLDMFAYALKPGGYLFLGNAESIDGISTAFETISKEHRILRLRGDAGANARGRIPSRLIATEIHPRSGSRGKPVTHSFDTRRGKPLEALHDRALAAASPPSVLINADYEIERVSRGASDFIVFSAGVPTRNLLNNVAPDIRLELRAALYRASASQQRVKAVFSRRDQEGRATGPVMTLTVDPVKSADEESMYWLVLFDQPPEASAPLSEASDRDVTTYEAAIQRLEDENRALKSHLQDTLDRSAVSNEELKASNEELQAINEELRSAKEELETSKEELQSANEELTTVNFELRMKVDEAGRNNDDLSNLMEASEIATVFVDSGMRVKRFTPQARRLFSLIPSDVGRPLMDVTNRLRYDEIVEDATAAFRQLVPIERSVTSVDDEHYLARIQPYRTSQDKIGGAVLTFIDVTELRAAESRVQRTEERLRDAIASSKDFAVLSTDLHGVITTWNEGAAVMFGYRSDEIKGQSIDVLFTPEDRAEGAPKQERSAAARAGRAADERWHLRKDGTRFFCSGVMTPLNTSNGGGFVKIARDVSNAKRRESKYNEQMTQERRASARVKAGSDLKDRFLAEMAHELKQPLNLIQVNAELLIRLPETRHSAAVQRLGGTIMRAVSTQETIVNDLLDFSRVQTGKLRLHRQPIDVVEIVRRLSEAMAPDVARKDITLQLQAPDTVVCDCDAVRFEQIIWNLLGNAVKFTPAGGSIRVSVSVDERHATLEVSDTGIGISPDFLPKVFELFSQGEAAEPISPRRIGLGIGLALVRELVRAHGGSIEASSAGKGLGTSFRVRLPLSAAGLRQPDDSRSPMSLHHRILLVDDDGDSLSAFAELLRGEGADVDMTSSPKRALTMLEAGDYDVLLSDIRMTEMSGYELIKRARSLETPKRIRAFAVSGESGEASVREALAAGFDGHISKPVSLERLRMSLGEA